MLYVLSAYVWAEYSLHAPQGAHMIMNHARQLREERYACLVLWMFQGRPRSVELLKTLQLIDRKPGIGSGALRSCIIQRGSIQL